MFDTHAHTETCRYMSETSLRKKFDMLGYIAKVEKVAPAAKSSGSKKGPLDSAFAKMIKKEREVKTAKSQSVDDAEVVTVDRIRRWSNAGH